ncbi:50S ribosomal protein L9 [Treponema parvum]|uniref:Large ribosomal subunit protein bL9 n=1 Tax=Treponema parvum TaxID=138851 RepID=A0A975IEP9_9SPIR|nr:50S ribosomal protein L9 [Treponema parvum]QTQ14052.1 50S ribosomal protein L9 [Treponema parvum]
MKVILNKDVKYLGEEGDVKSVANGYARNYLLPRMLAVPYNEATVAIFEGRKAEIEARKEQKRKDSASLKERLEQTALIAEMPAGANGKLYGAVSALTVAELLHKSGFEIERKRIEIPGVTIKSTGKYHVTIKLYEAQTATVELTVKAQETAQEASPSDKKKEKGRRFSEDARAETETEEASSEPKPEEAKTEPVEEETSESGSEAVSS